MAKLYLVGRLTKDVELRYTQGANSIAIASFSVAVGKRYKKEGQPEASFWECTAFGGKAEFIAKYFGKGSRIILDGIIEDENYMTKDGVNKTVKRVTVVDVDFGDTKNSSGGTAQVTEQAVTQPVQSQPTQPTNTRQTFTRQVAPQPQANTVSNQTSVQAPKTATKSRVTKPAAQASAQSQPIPQAVNAQQAAFMQVSDFDDCDFAN